MRQVDQPTRHRLCPSSSAFSYPAVSLYVCLFVCVCVCVPNTVVLEKCGTTGIEALLLYRPSFVGRSRCPNGRLQDSEASLLRSTRNGKRLAGGPLQWYKDSLKVNLKRCSLDPKLLCLDAQNRSGWRSTCRAAVAEFEAARVEALHDKRARRNQGVHTGALACSSCPRICSSRIGLFAHVKTHPKWNNLSARRCSPCVCVCDYTAWRMSVVVTVISDVRGANDNGCHGHDGGGSSAI